MSDLARVWPAGSEPARGGQDLARVYGNGKELATAGNSNLGHDYRDDRTR